MNSILPPSPQDIKPVNAPPSVLPYLAASAIVVLLGVVFVLGLLTLRPAADPLVIIGAVFGPLLPLAASILSFMKSQETHLSVNSQLEAWKKEYGRMQRAESAIDATKQEQDRVADMDERFGTRKQSRSGDGAMQSTAIPGMVPGMMVPAPAAPIPVKIVSPDPVPVINVDPPKDGVKKD